MVQNYDTGTGHTLAAPQPDPTPPPRTGEAEQRAAAVTVITKYYYFGGSRIGMDRGRGFLSSGKPSFGFSQDRPGHDQLGDGRVGSVYGEARWTYGQIPTDGVEEASPSCREEAFRLNNHQMQNLNLDITIRIAGRTDAETSMRRSKPYFEFYFGR